MQPSLVNFLNHPKSVEVAEKLVVKSEPDVIELDPKKFGSRRYAPLWAAVLRQPGKKVAIRMTIPNERLFRTIRKAFWKIKAEDKANRNNWRSHCERDGDKIYFWITPADVTTRF